MLQFDAHTSISMVCEASNACSASDPSYKPAIQAVPDITMRLTVGYHWEVSTYALLMKRIRPCNAAKLRRLARVACEGQSLLEPA